MAGFPSGREQPRELGGAVVGGPVQVVINSQKSGVGAAQLVMDALDVGEIAATNATELTLAVLNTDTVSDGLFVPPQCTIVLLACSSHMYDLGPSCSYLSQVQRMIGGSAATGIGPLGYFVTDSAPVSNTHAHGVDHTAFGKGALLYNATSVARLGLRLYAKQPGGAAVAGKMNALFRYAVLQGNPFNVPQGLWV